tara:strand:- start:245 stop:553 length:309 start_codon:yes stop_codon:yes gene_type:complete
MKNLQVNLQNRYGQTALINTAANGRHEVTHSLLAHGVNVHIKDINGRDALMFAVEKDQAATVKILLKCGTNRNTKDTNGHIALSIAKNNRDNDIVLLLQSIH